MKAVLPYFTAGWPRPDAFLEAVAGAAEAGCPAFEVGIPFTDPVADGPVIQRTSKEALESGITVHQALELTKQASERSGLPAIAMTYANLVFKNDLYAKLADAGVRGLILPDVPLEESAPFQKKANAVGIDYIHLCAPTTPMERVKRLAEETQRFLYLVSLKGVTGAEMPADVVERIQQVKTVCDKPLLVGFGVSTPEHVARLTRYADGVIVGSALLQQLESWAKTRDVRARTREYLSQMMEGLCSLS